MPQASLPEVLGNAPPSFICPITRDVMADPVIDPDGNSYEHLAILQHLQDSEVSPITRNRLVVADLRPNRGLKGDCLS